MSHPEQVRQRIIELEVEHRDLDVVINTLTKEPDMMSYNCDA